MCVCALNHRIVKPWEKPREKRTPTRRLSRDRTRWSGIHGWLYGLVRTSALGRVVDLSLNPEASKCRGEGEGRLPRAPAHAVGKYVIGFISILILSISYINTYFNKYLRKYYIILILFLNILSIFFLFLFFLFFFFLLYIFFLYLFLFFLYLS